MSRHSCAPERCAPHHVTRPPGGTGFGPCHRLQPRCGGRRLRQARLPRPDRVRDRRHHQDPHHPARGHPLRVRQCPAEAWLEAGRRGGEARRADHRPRHHADRRPSAPSHGPASGGGIAPGEFDEFAISAGPFPKVTCDDLHRRADLRRRRGRRLGRADRRRARRSRSTQRRPSSSPLPTTTEACSRRRGRRPRSGPVRSRTRRRPRRTVPGAASESTTCLGSSSPCRRRPGHPAVGIGPAAAHASLVRTDPADGSSLATAPRHGHADVQRERRQRLRRRHRARAGTRSRRRTCAPSTTCCPPTSPPSDERGRYTVAYRVVSADGHPVSGEFTFTTTTGACGRSRPTPTQRESFAHRHRGHLVLGLAVAVLAIGLILAPLRRGRNA